MAYSYTLSHERIEFTGGYISVRGLSIPEIQQIVSVNSEAAMILFEEIKQVAAEQKEIDIAFFVFSILNRFSVAVAHAIALAADVPNDIEGISKLPPDVQVAALEKIATLSFAMDGGAKKFWQTVLRLVGEKGGLLEKAKPHIETFTSGFGHSAVN
jgi:hypothetical protein